MRRERDALLWSSMVFAMIIGALAFGDIYIYDLIRVSAGAPGPTSVDLVAEYALSAMPGAMLSWLMIVVIPRQAGALTGGCAGLLTVVFAVLGVMLVAAFSLSHISGSHSSGDSASLSPVLALLWIFMLWISTVASFAYLPWGWVTFLVSAVAGALYGAYIARYLRRHFPEAYEEKPVASGNMRP